ncbi:MAG: 50S ribosomal protein L16 [Bacilli bacterium]|nr:50S ribosomal protein L16 [Bacilli bacterium]
MLQPKRVKYRRPHGLSYEGKPKSATTVDFGEYGLMALDGCYINNHQIESARIVLARYTDRAGKVWIRMFPHMAVTKKPAEVRMGSGKGNPEGWAAVVKAGMIMFEVGGIDGKIAMEALRLAAYKLPCRCKVVKRTKALNASELAMMGETHESSLEALAAEAAEEKVTISDTGNDAPAESEEAK